MVLTVKFMVLIVKIFITYIKMYIFYIKHDGDVIGDAFDGTMASLWDEYYYYKELLF